MRYEIWRHGKLILMGNSQAVKKWMLGNLHSEYHHDINRADRTCSKNYSFNRPALNWIAVNSEQC